MNNITPNKTILVEALNCYIERLKEKPIDNFFKAKMVMEELEKLETEVAAFDLLSRHGGKWLGAARSWIQSSAINGDRVEWGSDDNLLFRTITVRKIERLASIVAAAAMNE